MTHLIRPLPLLVIGLGCLTAPAREFEGARQNSILLNGPWEFVRGDGNEGAESAAGQRNLSWQSVTLESQVAGCEVLGERQVNPPLVEEGGTAVDGEDKAFSRMRVVKLAKHIFVFENGCQRRAPRNIRKEDPWFKYCEGANVVDTQTFEKFSFTPFRFLIGRDQTAVN